MSLTQAIDPDSRALTRTPRNKGGRECTKEDEIGDGIISLDQLEPTSVDPEGGDVTLGKGSFGSVQKVKQIGTENIFALKSIRKAEVIDGQLIDQVEREIHVQGQLRHENILRLFRHFEDETCVHLLLEYCAKGELYQLLRTRKGRRFSEPTACRYFVQVCKGLQYLHKHGIVHRDLKPENLLVDSEDVVKIADFGWCAMTQSLNTARNTFCGTLDYLAPEMIRAQGHDDKLDVWGLGVLLFEMIIGKPPFQSTNHAQLILKILNIDIKKVLSDRNLEFPDLFSVPVQDLIFKLLQRSPQKRISIDEALKHEWVKMEGKIKRSPKTGQLSNSDSFTLSERCKAKTNGINASTSPPPKSLKKNSVASAPGGANGPNRVRTSWFDTQEARNKSENNNSNVPQAHQNGEEKNNQSQAYAEQRIGHNTHSRDAASTPAHNNTVVSMCASNGLSNDPELRQQSSKNVLTGGYEVGNGIEDQQIRSPAVHYPLLASLPPAACVTPPAPMTDNYKINFPVTPVQQVPFLRASGCYSPIAPTRRAEPLYSETARARARSAAPRVPSTAQSPWRSPLLNFREPRIPAVERKMPDSTPSIIALHANAERSPLIHFRQLPSPIALNGGQFCLPNRNPQHSSTVPRTQVNAPSFSQPMPFLPPTRVLGVTQTPLLGCRNIGGIMQANSASAPMQPLILYTPLNGQGHQQGGPSTCAASAGGAGAGSVGINNQYNNSFNHTHHTHSQYHTPAPAMGRTHPASTPTTGGVDRCMPPRRRMGGR